MTGITRLSRPARRCLITGGAGFIGANFVHYWSNQYPEGLVIVLDALTYAGNLRSLQELETRQNFLFIRGNITDEAQIESIFSTYAIDTVFHFAAESHVCRSIHDPRDFINTNIVGTFTLLEAARRHWLDVVPPVEGHFHHVSTDEVFGSLGPEDPRFDERTPYMPNSPYAASKAGADHLVRAYHHTYGLRTTTTNCSNNYGPYHFPEKLIPLMILNILRGQALPVYGNGLNVRDWLFVTDHCRAIDAVVERGRPGETYAIGGDCERRNIDIVNSLCGLLDEAFAKDPALRSRFPHAPAAKGQSSRSLISFVADRPGHDLRYAINGAKIGQELGFQPLETLETGLAKTVAWYLENESWWRPILDGSYNDWIELQYGSRSAA